MDPITHCGLGLAYYGLKHYDEAALSCQAAIRLKPDYAVARFNLGVVYLALKDRNAVIEQYRILKDLNPLLARELYAGIYQDQLLELKKVA